MQVSEETRQAIYARVDADLRPARRVVHGKIGSSVLIGGLLSLFLCGQLGFGLSSLSRAVYTYLMTYLGFLGCAAACGVIFATLPVLSLRVMCRPMQFRTIVRKEWRAQIVWICVFGGILALFGPADDKLWTVVLWSSAAVVSFEGLARLVDALMQLASPRSSLKRP